MKGIMKKIIAVTLVIAMAFGVGTFASVKTKALSGTHIVKEEVFTVQPGKAVNESFVPELETLDIECFGGVYASNFEEFGLAYDEKGLTDKVKISGTAQKAGVATLEIDYYDNKGNTVYYIVAVRCQAIEEKINVKEPIVLGQNYSRSITPEIGKLVGDYTIGKGAGDYSTLSAFGLTANATKTSLDISGTPDKRVGIAKQQTTYEDNYGNKIVINLEFDVQNSTIYNKYTAEAKPGTEFFKEYQVDTSSLKSSPIYGSYETDYDNLADFGLNKKITRDKIIISGNPTKTGDAECQFTYYDLYGNTVTYIISLPIRYDIINVTLDKSSVYYSTSMKNPTVSVVHDRGSLTADKDYEDNFVQVMYDENCKIPGKHAVTVKGNALCRGTKYVEYTVDVKNSKIKSIKKGKKKLTVKWSKVDKKYISGYQLRYSTSKKMKSAKKVSASVSKTSTTIKKLKKKKTYYVQIRTYAKIDGKKYYASWSKSKKGKTK